MTTAETPMESSSTDESQLHVKKKEFRELKKKFNELRDRIRADTAEKKIIEEKLTPMAAELGIEFRSSKRAKVTD